MKNPGGVGVVHRYGPGTSLTEQLRIRMPRRPQHLGRRPLLDNPARIHHRDPVGHLRHHSKVMRDKEQTKLQLSSQAIQKLEDLLLYSDVQSRRRLIGNQQLGARGDRD